jgi:putative addiction module component (TIGR02574 family)
MANVIFHPDGSALAHQFCYSPLIRFNRSDAMTATMKDFGIDQLNVEQRVALALEIWDSLGEARPTGQLTAAQKAELVRRDAELDANPEIALSWEEIRASVEAKP